MKKHFLSYFLFLFPFYSIVNAQDTSCSNAILEKYLTDFYKNKIHFQKKDSIQSIVDFNILPIIDTVLIKSKNENNIYIECFNYKRNVYYSEINDSLSVGINQNVEENQLCDSVFAIKDVFSFFVFDKKNKTYYSFTSKYLDSDLTTLSEASFFLKTLLFAQICNVSSFNYEKIEIIHIPYLNNDFEENIYYTNIKTTKQRLWKNILTKDFIDYFNNIIIYK